VLTRATVEEPGDLPAAEEPAAVAEAATEADDEPAIAPRRPTRGGRRAAVPSWDEILFGAGTKRDE
jgi:hypothetical protein